MRYGQAIRELKLQGAGVVGGAGAILATKGQSWSGVTGTMAAGFASGATVGAVRYSVDATSRFLIQWMHLHYVCIGAFTTPVTAGRRLNCRRGSGGTGVPSGGTDLDFVRDESTSVETLLTGQIATTAALTMTGVTLETAPRARLLLAQAGAAGNDYDEIWTWDDPFVLRPGQLAAIAAGQTFDAAGTWQLEWKGHGVEL